MSGKKIVMLGGTGFVGRHLVPRLTAQGHCVTVLSRNRDKHPELRVLPQARVVNARVYECDELVRHLDGADVAINLVGILNERGRSGAGFRRAHVELTATLIRACREAGVRRLLQMSALNAGQGRSHYLRTRGEAESLVKDSGLQWTLFQPSVIFGRGDGLFTRFATLLKLAPVMPLARAGARFAPVFVGDVAQGFVLAVADRQTLARTYPMGGPAVMTLAEIVRYTAHHLGLKRLVVPLPDVLGRLQAFAFDFVPGKPFSTDNYLSLLLDSVPQEDGLAALGIQATHVDTVVPAYLRGLSRQTRLDGYRRYRSR
ncbi:MAG TPA: complex I NDUFA9 subunit family protein [Xanthomonadaceae bacterium]|nr:complex I NDUFA9 subunit family protein [Xanthomonadaceae bacterium]